MAGDVHNQNDRTDTEEWPRLLGGTVLVLLVFGIGFYVFFTIDIHNKMPYSNETAERAAPDDPFIDLVLEARSAYILDSTDGQEVFSKNGEAQLPLASLSKLMTALIASETFPERASIPITEHAVATEGDSGLRVGERWQLHDLIGFTLMVSSNDGATALAAAAGALGSTNALDQSANHNRFVSRMNEKARELGLTQTFFVNETGLDTTKRSSGSYGSARDVSRLMEHILKYRPDTLEATQYPKLSFVSENGIVHEAVNTNAAFSDIPALRGGKTGFTDLAGGNLTIAFDAGPGHTLIITVLGSSESGRFRDVAKLVRASLASLD